MRNLHYKIGNHILRNIKHIITYETCKDVYEFIDYIQIVVTQQIYFEIAPDYQHKDHVMRTGFDVNLK